MSCSLSRSVSLALLAFALFAPCVRGDETPQAEAARGIVYLDTNANGTFDSGDEPLADVKVSNGREIVTTDAAGRYELPVDDDTIIFVLKPRGLRTPFSDLHLPKFYYIHKPQGSPDSHFAGVAPTGPLPDSIDFPLCRNAEPDQFRAVLFGDTQPRNQEEVDYIAHDVVEELIGTDASFGVTLGDIVFDDLDVFDALNRTVALIGIPWYNVMGNHDINYDAKDDRHSDETFERVYGPPYYSFDHGPVHFIVLDDIEWFIPEAGENGQQGEGQYRGGLGEEQMAFVRNDLAMIPEDQLVVLMMHIPLTDVRDRHELYRLIEKRPFCISISGHTHYHEHRFIHHEDGFMGPKPHHHIINVTVCGSWWTGAPDERGIPHTLMRDGAPNGYSIISFDGTDYRLDFKAAGRSEDYQMQIEAPESVPADKLADTNVYVNVFNGSERSRVEIRLDNGGWTSMQHAVENDPNFVAVSEREAAILEKIKAFRELPDVGTSAHLWKSPLPADVTAGTHLIEVRATDINDTEHVSHRVIRVTNAVPEAKESVPEAKE
ncbi:MAG: calcineurin-like phosphoesterase family protein [Pirellulales bacterium]